MSVARKVNENPALPRPSGNSTNAYLAQFDQHLVRTLFTELMEHARRLNIAVMNDGSEGPVQLPVYAKADLPAPKQGAMIYVTDDTGGEVPAFGTATEWRRVTDRNVIS